MISFTAYLTQNDDLDGFQGCQSRPRVNVFDCENQGRGRTGWNQVLACGVYDIRSMFRLQEIFELEYTG